MTRARVRRNRADLSSVQEEKGHQLVDRVDLSSARRCVRVPDSWHSNDAQPGDLPVISGRGGFRRHAGCDLIAPVGTLLSNGMTNCTCPLLDMYFKE